MKKRHPSTISVTILDALAGFAWRIRYLRQSKHAVAALEPTPRPRLLDKRRNEHSHQTQRFSADSIAEGAARGGEAGRSIEMASDCHLAVVRQLLWLCPPERVLEMLNYQRVHRGGYTPLMAAAARGRVKTVRLLLDAGADSAVCDHHGATAMDWARCFRQTPVSRLLHNRQCNTLSAVWPTKSERGGGQVDALEEVQRSQLSRIALAKLPEHEQP